jgi:hypothetical protein
VTKDPGTHVTPDALIERPYPLADGGTGVDLYIKAEVFRDASAGDLPKATTRLMEAEQRPFSVAAFTEASGTRRGRPCRPGRIRLIRRWSEHARSG